MHGNGPFAPGAPQPPALAPTPTPPPVQPQSKPFDGQALLAAYPETDGRATLALVLGILSVTCLGFLSGIPAVILGMAARRDIDRSAGAKMGGGMAVGGIVTGVLGTLASSAMLLAFVAGIVEASTRDHTPAPERPQASVAPEVPDRAPHTKRPGARPSPRGTAPHPDADDGTGSPTDEPTDEPHAGGRRAAASLTPQQFGAIQVITLGTHEKRSLEDLLADAQRSVGKRQLILQTSAPGCSACREFESSLMDARMQRALTNVTLVKVDVRAFGDELEDLNVVTKTLPWFYKFNAELKATDAISAGEWDANIPANMAPVLEAFVAGTLLKRREPSPLHGPQL